MTELGTPIMPISNLLEFSMTASTKLCKKNRLQLSHAKRAILQEWREADKNAVRARGSSLDPIEEEVSRIGFAGIIAGTFDFLGLEGLIDSLVGKIGSHVMVNTGAITKSLVMQMLQASKTASGATNLPSCTVFRSQTPRLGGQGGIRQCT